MEPPMSGGAVDCSSKAECDEHYGAGALRQDTAWPPSNRGGSQPLNSTLPPWSNSPDMLDPYNRMSQQQGGLASARYAHQMGRGQPGQQIRGGQPGNYGPRGSQQQPSPSVNFNRQHLGSGRVRGGLMRGNNYGNNQYPKGNNTGPGPSSVTVIRAVTGDSLVFSETNMDWTKLNIFRTRLCDRLTQTHSCHMANRCLFSHDVAWPRRTPFLPRATALTLRYIPVWCPRVAWPPIEGYCDSFGRISWNVTDEGSYNNHQRCIRGDNCPFVHNLEEFLYHPEVYKTRMCCLANDESIGEDGSSAALCPWYFCPFAHYLWELRDVRSARYAWHQPPQTVEDHFVARTQGFDSCELALIDSLRKSPGGSLELYISGNSPLRQLLWGKNLLPPVFRPLPQSSLGKVRSSEWHRNVEFDDLLYFSVVASLLNLLLYPVENFYTPTLLSLQCAALEYQLNLPKGSPQKDCSALLHAYDSALQDRKPLALPSGGRSSWDTPSKCVDADASPATAPAASTTRTSPESDLESFLEALNPEDLMKMVEMFATDSAAARGDVMEAARAAKTGGDSLTELTSAVRSALNAAVTGGSGASIADQLSPTSTAATTAAGGQCGDTESNMASLNEEDGSPSMSVQTGGHHHLQEGGLSIKDITMSS